MANLETRQKIILGITAIAVLYGAVDFLLPGKKGGDFDPRKKSEELNAFVATLSTGGGRDDEKGPGSPLILARAEKEWVRDPFLGENSLKAWIKAKERLKQEPPKGGAGRETPPPPKIEFIYAGYIEAGQKRMAVINGVEYREGDALEIKGYVLKSVSAADVVIENQATKATLTVPLQE